MGYEQDPAQPFDGIVDVAASTPAASVLPEGAETFVVYGYTSDMGVSNKPPETPSSAMLPAGAEQFEVHGYTGTLTFSRRFLLGLYAHVEIHHQIDVRLYWNVGGSLQELMPSYLYQKGEYIQGGLPDFGSAVGDTGEVWFGALTGYCIKKIISLADHWQSYDPYEGAVYIFDANHDPAVGEAVKLPDVSIVIVTGDDGGASLLWLDSETITVLRDSVTDTLNFPGENTYQYAGMELKAITSQGYLMVGAEVILSKVSGDDYFVGIIGSEGLYTHYKLKLDCTYDVTISNYTLRFTTGGAGEILSILFNPATAPDNGWTPPPDYPITVGDILFFLKDKSTKEPIANAAIVITDGTLTYSLITDQLGFAATSIPTVEFTATVLPLGKRYNKYEEIVTLTEGEVRWVRLEIERKTAITQR